MSINSFSVKNCLVAFQRSGVNDEGFDEMALAMRNAPSAFREVARLETCEFADNVLVEPRLNATAARALRQYSQP